MREEYSSTAQKESLRNLPSICRLKLQTTDIISKTQKYLSVIAAFQISRVSM